MISLKKLRYPGETFSLLFSIIIALLTISFILEFSYWLLIIIIIGQLLYVIIGQKQIQGNSIIITSKQYPEINKIIEESCIKLEMVKPDCFITFDPYINAFVMGFKKPYTLVITTALIEAMDNEELKFVIAHELGHIKMNHSRLKSLVMPLDRNIPVITMIFNFWLRKSEYTADRIGLYVVENVKISTNALLKLTVGAKLYKGIKVEELISQITTSYDEFMEKIGELFLTHPYITNRIHNIVEFFNFDIKKTDGNNL